MAVPYLDIRCLRYFHSIAQTGSLSGAARLLNVAQPALTHQIAELERSIGCAVFIRTSRGVLLTEVGRLLEEHAAIILQQVATAEAALHEMTRLDAGIELQMGLSPSVSVLAPDLMRAFTVIPNLRLRLAEVRARECWTRVLDGRLDLSLTVGTPDSEGAIVVHEEAFYLVAKATGTPPPETITVAELAGLPDLIQAGVGSHIREVTEQATAGIGRKLAVSMEIDGFNSRKQAVLQGLGSALMPMRSVQAEVRAGSITARRIVDPPLAGYLVLHHRRDFDPDFAARISALVIGVVKEATAEEGSAPAP